MVLSGQCHDPAALTPRKQASGIHWTGGCVSLEVVLDAVLTQIKLRSGSGSETGAEIEEPSIQSVGIFLNTIANLSFTVK